MWFRLLRLSEPDSSIIGVKNDLHPPYSQAVAQAGLRDLS
jgi:hypothetical protein